MILGKKYRLKLHNSLKKYIYIIQFWQMTLQVFGFEHQLDDFKLLSYWAGIQFSKKRGNFSREYCADSIWQQVEFERLCRTETRHDRWAAVSVLQQATNNQ